MKCFGYEFWWNTVQHAISQSSTAQYNKTTRLKKLLQEECGGVAICDMRDGFNRERGRIIAKGRLLKHLKEEKFLENGRKDGTKGIGDGEGNRRTR